MEINDEKQWEERVFQGPEGFYSSLLKMETDKGVFNDEYDNRYLCT
ncbi:hypothetical protein [Bacillus sp. FJAT-44742]|nr:hypothetical protein [Bacillus sp. FJAT-44742]